MGKIALSIAEDGDLINHSSLKTWIVVDLKPGTRPRRTDQVKKRQHFHPLSFLGSFLAWELPRKMTTMIIMTIIMIIIIITIFVVLEVKKGGQITMPASMQNAHLMCTF